MCEGGVSVQYPEQRAASCSHSCLPPIPLFTHLHPLQRACPCGMRCSGRTSAPQRRLQRSLPQGTQPSRWLVRMCLWCGRTFPHFICLQFGVLSSPRMAFIDRAPSTPSPPSPTPQVNSGGRGPVSAEWFLCKSLWWVLSSAGVVGASVACSAQHLQAHGRCREWQGPCGHTQRCAPPPPPPSLHRLKKNDPATWAAATYVCEFQGVRVPGA